jgi:hypothetical protein
MVDVTLIELDEEETTHQCSVCSFDYDEAEGGIEGYFGIYRVNFCPGCYSSMLDLVHYQQMIDDEETSHTNH